MNMFIRCALISLMSFIYWGCSSTQMLKSEFKEDAISRVNMDELMRKANQFNASPLLDRLVILDKVIHQIHLDGHRLTEVHQVSKCLNDQSKSQVIELFFRQGYQDIQPIEAYTLIGNQRIDAKIERQYPFAHLKKQWPSYKELMLVRIQFNGVEKGAILSLRYQLHHYFSDLPPFLDGLIVLNYPFPIVKQKSLVMVPKQMELKSKLVNTLLKVERVEKDGWQIFSIEQDWPKLVKKNQKASHHAGRWMFSTVTNFSAMYQHMYQFLNTNQLVDVSSKLTHLFDDIKEKNTSFKIQKLYHFVTMQNNITNIPIPFGASGYIPQAPEQILEHGYAQAKDKISLLSVLLKHEDIPHAIALTDEVFPLDPKFPLFSQLNRPLIAIGEKHDNQNLLQFLDPYSILSSYPYLPQSLYGRWVMLLYSNGAKYVRIPMINASDNTLHYDIESELDANGNLDYSALVSSSGPYETQQRMNILQLRMQNPNDSFEESYRLNYEFLPHIQLLSAKSLDPMNLEQAFQYQVEFRLKSSVFDVMQPLSKWQSSDKKNLSISLDLYPHPFASSLDEVKNFQFDLPFRHEIVHRLHFNPNWKIEKYPDNIEISNELFDYQSQYKQLPNNEIELRRVVRLKNITTQEKDYKQLMQWLHQIKLHEQDRIKFKKAT